MKETQTTKPQAPEEVLEFLQKRRKGDIARLSQITREKGMNAGQGFTPDYISKVLVYRSRKNDEIVQLARQYQIALNRLGEKSSSL